jgi:hypothetical protein
MPDQRGWPDPANPGVPANPDQEGPHWIEDEHGAQRWFWWLPVSGAWFSSSLQCSPAAAAKHWTYIEAAVVPEKPAQFQTQVAQPPRR